MKQCIAANQKHGRTVSLNDYEPEYETLRQRKQTDEYAAVKAEHPKVERRLGELVNRLKGRRARYRGLAESSNTTRNPSQQYPFPAASSGLPLNENAKSER